MAHVVPSGAIPKKARGDSHQSQVKESSVHSKYSSDTFESFTEEEVEEEKEVVEEEERCHVREGKSSASLVSSAECQTWSGTSGSHAMSKKLSLILNDGEEPVNPLNSVGLEKKLSQKWIQVLKAKESPAGQPQAGPAAQAEVGETSMTAQDMSLKAFCVAKINVIRRSSLKAEYTSGSHYQSQQQTLEAEDPVSREGTDRIVPFQLINRIHQQNLRATHSQASAFKEHVCSQCPHCTKKRGELAQLSFLRQKKTFLESALLKEKMDEHRRTKDFLSLVGEIHRSLPSISDDPETIWKRLNALGHVG